MAADSGNRYALNYELYLGKDKDGEHSMNGLGYSVMMSMTEPYWNKFHHVFFDNFFNSPKLLVDLMNKNTYACGTVKPKCKGLPPPPSSKLKPGEKVVLQKGLTNLVYTQWHDKRDVRVLSTNACPKESDVPIQRRQRNTPEPEVVNKPQVIVTYNNNMGGVDLSDQLRSYYSLARTLHKLYKYIFYFLLDLAIGNAYILEKEL